MPSQTITTDQLPKMSEPCQHPAEVHARSSKFRMALLTGGFDKSYVVGLVAALSLKRICMDVIGSTEVYDSRFDEYSSLEFVNLKRRKVNATRIQKIADLLMYYLRLLKYALTSKAAIFHILWNNKFELFDRTCLMLYYKLMSKKLILTAHNVNAGKRDGNDSVLNRLTLKIQYKLCDHIFVHTDKMKQELTEEFGISSRSVTVIPFGINDSLPETSLTALEAKQHFDIPADAKTILFFGSIRPYKGLDRLLDAFWQVSEEDSGYRLLIAGEPRRETDGPYADRIMDRIRRHPVSHQVIAHMRHIPDEQVELYFKAADLLVLPYAEVFQSGVLFLGYNFGLPAIATNVGSFRDDIVPGETGYLCPSTDARDFASTIGAYFDSNLFKNLQNRRPEIRAYALARNSWAVVGERTRKVYADLTGN